MYAPPLVAALSGTTVRQLQYWRKTTLLAPDYWSKKQVLYSYPDLIALRTFGYLRERYTLQQIRRAVTALRGFLPTDHLSTYKIVDAGGTIALLEGDAATDLLRRPGNGLIAPMDEVFRSFRSLAGKEIVPLERPSQGVLIDSAIRGGFPVVEGTRVPFDVVANLRRDGLSAEEVSDYFPTVDPRGADGALMLADYVDEYVTTTAA